MCVMRASVFRGCSCASAPLTSTMLKPVAFPLVNEPFFADLLQAPVFGLWLSRLVCPKESFTTLCVAIAPCGSEVLRPYSSMSHTRRPT